VLKNPFLTAFLLSLILIGQCSLGNISVRSAVVSTKIAWVHANYLVMLSDELSYLKTLDADRYSYDEYTEDNIDSFWANLDSYKAVLIDEDCIYSWQTGAKLPLYTSFYHHKTQLDQWVWSGGGLFITDNNDLYNINFTPYRLVWDWLPKNLEVASIDLGKDASGGHLKIVDNTHWLFSTPNKLDHEYINDPSGGHAHGYFLVSECPGYSTLVVRTDAGYENQPVEIAKNYGIGVTVISHAELEDGNSWKYVQNEIDNVLLSPRGQLISSLNMLNRTICELIVENTRITAEMRSNSIGVLDPNRFGLAFDILKLALSILMAASGNYGVYSDLTSGEVKALSLANAYMKGTSSGLDWVNIGFSGYYKAENALVKPDENFNWNLVFKDKEAQLIVSGEERTAHYFEILMGRTEDGTEIWPRHGIYDGQTLFYGADDILSHMIQKYNDFVSSLQPVLPSTFDLQYTLSYLNDLRRSVREAMTSQTTTSFYDATNRKGAIVELGSLHALEKSLEFSIMEFKNAQDLNTILWAATSIWHCIKLAVGIPTAGAGTLALLAFNVIVGALDFAANQRNQEIQMRSRDLVVQDLLRSMSVLDTEAVICKGILTETTKFVNELLASAGVTIPLIKITNVDIPDISTKETFGGGSGDIGVNNIGSSDAFVTLFITFYAAPQRTNIWLEMVDVGTIPRNSKSSVHFTFSLPKTEMFGCEQYYADIRAYAASDLGTYLTDHFTPTPSFYIGEDCGCQVKDIAHQNLAQGEIRSLTYTSTGKSTRFILWYRGSRINLHLYDSEGRHVGVDYYSGKIENEIPNSQYSGADAIPEWIYVSDSAKKIFTLNVVGVNLPQPENFTLTATEIPVLPALLTQLPTKVYEECSPGDTIEFPVTFIEYGGQSGFASITLRQSALMGSSGTNIAKDMIRFSNNSFSLQSRSSRTVLATIGVPEDVRNGLYTGLIEVIVTGAAIQTPVEIYVVGYLIRLSNSPSNAGSIAINGTNYEALTNSSYAGTWMVTATPSEGYVFDHWVASQNATATEPTSATTSVTFTGPGTLQAVYVSRQTGLPFWLVAAVLAAISASTASVIALHRRRSKKITSKAGSQTLKASIRICPYCQSVNRPNTKFCGKCGKPF
jgi:hypothetical protein